MLKAVIFDMDGVIIDSEPFHLKVNREIFRELNIKFSEKEYSAYIGVSNDEMWSDIKEKNNLSQSVAYLKQLQIKKDMDYLQKMDDKPIDGIMELLNELKYGNIPTALASSSSVKYIGMVLDSFNISDFFSVIVSGENMKRGKPAPDIFLHTASLLKVAPGSCVVIEDSRNGVIAAKAAGMRCVGFQNPNSVNQDISASDIIVGSIKELNLQSIKQIM